MEACGTPATAVAADSPRPDDGAPEAPGGAPPSGLRERAVRASAWVLAGQPIGIALKLVKNLVLTRLLIQTDFGVMALVGVVLTGLQMISDVGIEVSVIGHKDGEKEDFLRTAWTVQLVRGIALWLVCCALAWPAAAFYAEPQLLLLIPVAGFRMVIYGLQSTSIILLRRRLRWGPLTAMFYAQEIVEFVVMILLVLVTRSVWGLVLSSVLASALAVAAGYVIFPGIKHRLAWNSKVAASLVHVGKWVLVSSGLTFLARQGDKMMLGKLEDLAILGVYNIALNLATMPRDVIAGLSNQILFPAISETARTDSDAIERRLLKARSLLLRTALLAIGSVAIVAPLFFFTLYTPPYWPAGHMAQLLVLHAWFGALLSTSSSTFLALGDTKAMTLVNGVSFVAGAALGYAGHVVAGLDGFIVGMGVGLFLAQAFAQTLLARRGVRIRKQDLIFTVAIAAWVLAGIGVTHLVATAVPEAPRWVVDVSVSALWLGVPGLWMGRTIWKEVFRR